MEQSMTLEQRINALGLVNNIEFWQASWVANPIRETRGLKKGFRVVNDVDIMIEEADPAECYLSPSPYIREYRRRWEEKKNGK